MAIVRLVCIPDRLMMKDLFEGRMIRAENLISNSSSSQNGAEFSLVA